MLFAGLRSVRMVKNCDLGFENAARGRRPRAAFSRPRSQFFPIRTSQPVNNIYILCKFDSSACERSFLLVGHRTRVVDSHRGDLIAPFPLGQNCPDVLFHVVIAEGLFFPTKLFSTWLYRTYQSAFTASETSQFMNIYMKLVKARDGISSEDAETFLRTGELSTVPLVKKKLKGCALFRVFSRSCKVANFHFNAYIINVQISSCLFFLNFLENFNCLKLTMVCSNINVLFRQSIRIFDLTSLASDSRFS